MKRNEPRKKPAKKRQLLFIFAAATNIAAFAQTTPSPRIVADLAAPALKAHANLTWHNRPGQRISEALVGARDRAPSLGIIWKGLDYIVPDEAGDISGLDILKLYQKQTCDADVVAVGRISSWASHLSASETTVYSDYAFVIDALLKDNPKSSIRSHESIVVTRPGGSLSMDEGFVKFDLHEFPQLKLGITYLLFLRYIPESSGYEGLDSFSTLVASENRWLIARKAFSHFIIPGFTPELLETSIGNWLGSCK